jgi:C1A family cysteine protease
LGSSALAAGPLSLSDLKRAMNHSGPGWVAGHTSVSALPRETWKKMLGVPLQSIQKSPFVVTRRSGGSGGSGSGSTAPANFDWRNVGGVNYVSPILDQGQCGSCVAFATIGTFETQLNITSKTSLSPWQLSPEYLFSCGGGSCDSGWEVDSAMQFLVDSGTTDDACMPYTSGANGSDAQCSAACSNASNRVVQATTYSQVGSSTSAVKAALQKGPLAATMTVYEDFMYYKSGVYKHVSGSVAGGHAVSIVGWNDADGAWIVRNSWGAGWGMNGFFEIAYGDVSGVGRETWSVQVAPVGSFVALALRDGTLLSGTQTLQFNTQSVSGNPTWTLSQGTQQVANGASVDGHTAAFDTTTVADGIYTLSPHVAGIDGEPRLVYVLNGHETGAVTITSQTDGQTLSGIVTITFDTTSTPVPLTQVTFVLTDGNGNVKLSRATSDTGDSMQVGWDTSDVPNGTYTLTIGGSAGTQAITAATATVTISN